MGVLVKDGSDSSINYYSKLASKQKILSKGEELEHIKNYQKTLNIKYKEIIVGTNIKLLMKLCLKFIRSRNLKLEIFGDLMSEATLRLNRAIEKFDTARGLRLSTFSFYWINQSLNRSNSKNNLIKFPVRANQIYYKSIQVWRDLKIKNKEYPCTKQDWTNIYDQLIKENYNNIGEGIKFDTYFDIVLTYQNSEVSSYLEFNVTDTLEVYDINYNDNTDKDYNKKEIYKYLKYISPMKRYIICCRYGLGNIDIMTLDEIGQIICKSRERVRQLQNLALEELKNHIEKDNPVLRRINSE